MVMFSYVHWFSILANTLLIMVVQFEMLEISKELRLESKGSNNKFPLKERIDRREDDVALLDINNTLANLSTSNDYINMLQFNELIYDESLDNSVGPDVKRNIREVSQYSNDVDQNKFLMNSAESNITTQSTVTVENTIIHLENELEKNSNISMQTTNGQNTSSNLTGINNASTVSEISNFAATPKIPHTSNKIKPEMGMIVPKKFLNKTKIGVNWQNQSTQFEDKQKFPNKSFNDNISESTVNTNHSEGYANYSSSLHLNESLIANLGKNAVYNTGGNLNNLTESDHRTMLQEESFSALKIVLIVAVSIVIISGLTGIVVLSMALYRRYYWNKPQTLNDKCSNADSLGYIDDALKENSEEMYSLDNDSFLNSLEAMTIQNYWTESIRHTKL